MAPGTKRIYYIVLGAILLLACGLYFWKGRFPRKESAAQTKDSKSKPKKEGGSRENPEQQTAQLQQIHRQMQENSMTSITQTQSALRTIDEINRMNRMNQQLQKDLQQQERRIGQ